MCAIFKNTEVARDDIGKFMKAFAEEHKIMPRPRRTLIGSYYVEKILLATGSGWVFLFLSQKKGS